MPVVKLTARFVEALKACEIGQIDYRDSDLPGFGIRVASGGARPGWLCTGTAAGCGASLSASIRTCRWPRPAARRRTLSMTPEKVQVLPRQGRKNGGLRRSPSSLRNISSVTRVRSGAGEKMCAY